MNSSKKIAVLGAGIMGLACAYDLAKSGYQVNVFEKEGYLGGMSSSFDFEGLQIERFYHFICSPDKPYFDILNELHILDKLRWQETKMGFYYEGTLYEWGTPVKLLMFPKADILTKFRYGLNLFFSSKRTNWDDLDRKKAVEWLKEKAGVKAYDIFWKSLFEYKFYEFAEEISAAWIWARIKRVAVSRKDMFTERLGYLEGGTAIFIDKITDEIKKRGGKIFLNLGAEQILTSDGQVSGIVSGGRETEVDAVVSTLPLPYIADMLSPMPENMLKIKEINNIGVVCVILKLKNRITENFWVNVNDSTMRLPGFVEYSNLNESVSDHIVYLPFYLHKDNPKYSNSDEQFKSEAVSCLKKIRSGMNEDWVIAGGVHRYEYAQPICLPGFKQTIPPVRTGVFGLYVADASHYYPEDRSVSESIRLGREIAQMVQGDLY
jgi:protoporphyrinogen oxidase